MHENTVKKDSPLQVLAQVRWWTLIGPVGVVVIGVWLESTGRIHLNKPHLEAAALWILRTAVIVSLIGAIVRRDVFSAWLFCLTAVFLMREYHFAGTSNGVYIAVVLLGIVAWAGFHTMAVPLTHPLVATLLILTVFCYILGVTLDQWWWNFIPAVAQPSSDKTVGNLVEEMIENTGHFMLLTLTLITLCNVAKRNTPS